MRIEPTTCRVYSLTHLPLRHDWPHYNNNIIDILQNGRSAEDYYKNSTLFPLNQLLTDFGISGETAKTMFSDKGNLRTFISVHIFMQY